MKKILIVSLKAGAGHLMAAQALERELHHRYPDIEVKNIDFLDNVAILSKEFYGKWYMDMVSAVPKFYGWAYANIRPSSTNFRLIFDRINAQQFQKLVFDYDPDLIIATHFVPANIVSYWRKKYQKNYKIAVTVTDYEAHHLWVDNKVDKYYVANHDVKEQFVDMGLAAAKIENFGIPIDAKFSQKMDPEEIRKRLKLNKNFTVLITSGGFGMGPVPDIIKKLNILPKKINLLVMTGKNDELYANLLKMADQIKHKIQLFKFIENGEELVAVSDVVVGKPGGLTVSESLTVGKPIIIINPIPGQEVANANYLMRNLAGIKVDNEDELAVTIKHLIKNKEILTQLQQNARRISKPNSTAKIVADVVKLIKS